MGVKPGKESPSDRKSSDEYKLIKNFFSPIASNCEIFKLLTLDIILRRRVRKRMLINIVPSPQVSRLVLRVELRLYYV